MLTIRFDELRLRAGDLVLDVGAGFGRHVYECARRGGPRQRLAASARTCTPDGGSVVTGVTERKRPSPPTANAEKPRAFPSSRTGW